MWEQNEKSKTQKGPSFHQMDFQPSALWEINVWCLQVIWSSVFCYSSHEQTKTPTKQTSSLWQKLFSFSDSSSCSGYSTPEWWRWEKVQRWQNIHFWLIGAARYECTNDWAWATSSEGNPISVTSMVPVETDICLQLEAGPAGRCSTSWVGKLLHRLILRPWVFCRKESSCVEIEHWFHTLISQAPKVTPLKVQVLQAISSGIRVWISSFPGYLGSLNQIDLTFLCHNSTLSCQKKRERERKEKEKRAVCSY